MIIKHIELYNNHAKINSHNAIYGKRYFKQKLPFNKRNNFILYNKRHINLIDMLHKLQYTKFNGHAISLKVNLPP